MADSTQKSDSAQKFHPALTITNVKSLIPITLDSEHDMYHSWAALFTVLVRVHDLHHHIVPPTQGNELATYNASKTADPALWNCLDAVVFQWIYGTISTNLLQAILLKDDTAQGAWARLESMFQDNKASRATHIEEELAELDFNNFTSIDRYCTHIKSLADRLADVDAPLSNSRLVLKLTAGLPEAYAGTVDIIQNQEPLPSFESCRSHLKLAERTIKNRLAKEVNSGRPAALVAASNNTTASDSGAISSRPSSRGNKQKKGGKVSGKKSPNGNVPQNQPPGPFPWPNSPWTGWAPWFPNWSTPPPCPYPASSWTPRPFSNSGPRPTVPDILGTRPQAYTATAHVYSQMDQFGSYTPTDIEAAMSALSHSQPDGNFYMDIGATSHMTSDRGIFNSYFNSSIDNNIVVGSGHLVPTIGHGSFYLPRPYPPFHLKNILHAPKLIKNLVSVRKFTKDNSVSVEFDPFDFSINDLQTGTRIVRCDSTGDLYHLFNQATPPVNNSAFHSISSDIWHNRLGHPGDAVFRSLRNNNFIECNKACKTFFSSCPLGKLSKLPFYDSMSHTASPFDIIHSDL